MGRDKDIANANAPPRTALQTLVKFYGPQTKGLIMRLLNPLVCQPQIDSAAISSDLAETRKME